MGISILVQHDNLSAPTSQAQGLIVVETAFQSLSALCCAMALRNEIPLKNFDLAIYGMFAGAAEYGNRVRDLEVFNKVVYIEPFYGSESNQGMRHMLDLLTRRNQTYRIFTQHCAELLNASYSVLVIPTATRLPVDVRQFACNKSGVETFLYEEGTSSRTGNIGRAFALFDDILEKPSHVPHVKDLAKLTAKRCVNLLTHGKFLFNVTRYYFFNPTNDLRCLYGKIDVVPLDIHQLKIANILDNVFPIHRKEDLYKPGDVVVLTSARNAPREMLEIEQRIIEALASVKDINIVIRPHPRSEESFAEYQGRCRIDRDHDSWEVMCLSGIINEEVILVGSASTAQVNPRLLFGQEPYNIFLHRLVNSMDSKHLETIFSDTCASYNDKNRMAAPETIDDVVTFACRAIKSLTSQPDLNCAQ